MDFKEKFKQDLINEDVHLSLTREQRESIADLMDYQLRLYIVSQQRELLKSFADWLQGEVWNDKHDDFSDYVEDYIKTL